MYNYIYIASSIFFLTTTHFTTMLPSQVPSCHFTRACLMLCSVYAVQYVVCTCTCTCNKQFNRSTAAYLPVVHVHCYRIYASSIILQLTSQPISLPHLRIWNKYGLHIISSLFLNSQTIKSLQLATSYAYTTCIIIYSDICFTFMTVSRKRL